MKLKPNLFGVRIVSRTAKHTVEHKSRFCKGPSFSNCSYVFESLRAVRLEFYFRPLPWSINRGSSSKWAPVYERRRLNRAGPSRVGSGSGQRRGPLWRSGGRAGQRQGWHFDGQGRLQPWASELFSSSHEILLPPRPRDVLQSEFS